MRIILLPVALILVTVIITSCQHDPVVPADQIFYDTQIQPVLSSSCAQPDCHDAGGERRDLSSYTAVMKSGFVTAGDPRNSKLYTVLSANPHIGNIMPPKPAEPLSADMVRNIYVWILQGAKDTKDTATCDSVNVTFSQVIMPIINLNCISCHKTSYHPNTTVILDSYEGVKACADTANNNSNNLLLRSILHLSSYPMPKGGLMMSECNIAKFKKWIQDGEPNN